MIGIGKTYTEQINGSVRLCAPVRFGDRELDIWYGVTEEQKDALSTGRADPFVMALLPAAMRSGSDICSEDPMSERLHFQLRNDLIPTLCHAGALYLPVSLHTPLTSQRFPSAKAVSAVFSDRADSLYTIFRHGAGSEYPLTHLAVFRTGFHGEKDGENGFRDDCGRCGNFARKSGLKTVFVDSNLSDMLPEKQAEVEPFRLLSFALALQGLISVFLVSSVYPYEGFRVDAGNARLFDPLSVICACTESTQFYLSGAETDLVNKREELSRRESFSGLKEA